MNLLRERIKRGDRLCGTIVCLSDPCLCEVFGNIGYDFTFTLFNLFNYERINVIFDNFNGLFKVDDVNTVSFTEDVLLHFRIPTSCLVTEVYARF